MPGLLVILLSVAFGVGSFWTCRVKLRGAMTLLCSIGLCWCWVSLAASPTVEEAKELRIYELEADDGIIVKVVAFREDDHIQVVNIAKESDGAIFETAARGSHWIVRTTFKSDSMGLTWWRPKASFRVAP